MADYKNVQDRSWFNTLYDKNFADKDYDTAVILANIKHLQTAVLDWIISVEENG